MVLQDTAAVAVGLAVIVTATILRFLSKLYCARQRFARFRDEGLPMPPWNPILGHVYFCYQITSTLPSDAHGQYIADMVRRKLPDLGPIFYLDTWPFGPQILVVASVDGLYQITQEHSLPKYHVMKDFLRPITEGLDIVTMEGDQWRTWRGIFNPGFSASHLMSLTNVIMEETQSFCDNLRARVQDQRMFRMKDLTDNLTMDIIGRVVLDTRLESQTRSNPLVDGLRMQVKWLTFGIDINPIKRYNPVRPFVHWYNLRRMNKPVSAEIDKRVARLQGEGGYSDIEGSKSIIDLVLAASLSQNTAGKKNVLDKGFKKFIMSQIKLFLFSGHDTTSSTACYIFYVLATQPTVLARVRAEHESLLDPDASRIASLVASDPALLNRLPYTLAVIKETLRLYPAVSSTRAGEPGFYVTDDVGRKFPTNGLLVWANPQPIHRDPTYWPQADDFLPERWLVAPGDPLHPIKGAWRPFEHGPRNCIGQELAILELKVIMIMTVRRFELGLAYGELDQSKPKNTITNVYGERGYQIQRAQPSEDLPCRVANFVTSK